MYPTAVGREVRSSFSSLAEKPAAFSDADAELLRRRLCVAVDELKAMGWPIERIIIRIKEVAFEAGLSLGHNVHEADRHPALAKAVLWCVQHYYGVDDDPARR